MKPRRLQRATMGSMGFDLDALSLAIRRTEMMGRASRVKILGSSRVPDVLIPDAATVFPLRIWVLMIV